VAVDFAGVPGLAPKFPYATRISVRGLAMAPTGTEFNIRQGLLSASAHA
jgi:hypothetical protein